MVVKIGIGSKIRRPKKLKIDNIILAGIDFRIIKYKQKTNLYMR